MAVLKMLKGGAIGQVYPLVSDSMVLGRHPECEIVLEAGAVSRQHARIVCVGEEFYVEDLHSRNGTAVNSRRLESRKKLEDGDQLEICDLVFQFQMVPSEPIATTETPETTEGVRLVDDVAVGGSKIMSKLELSSAGRVRLTVSAETKLGALLEIGRDLGKAVRLDEVLPRILDNLFAIFERADRGFVVLLDPATGRLIPRAVKRRRESPNDQLCISRKIIHGVMTRREAVLSEDAATDSRFGMSESIVDFQIHSMMCAPLVDSGGTVLGVIQIDSTDLRRRFTQEDLEVLVSVAGQAAMAVENVQLHERRLQGELLERELRLAHRVQQGLLPSGPPELEGYEFIDLYEPANHLGGDYFDYIELPDGRLAVALADVMGKGIAAALLMARLSAQVPFCLAVQPTLAAAMARLNRIFCEGRYEGRFVTLVLTLLDPRTHQVTFVNAGHPSPLLRRVCGTVEPVGRDLNGLPVGIEEDSAYEQFTISLQAGESLTLYTDGIPDAMNAADERYGDERLKRQLELPATSAASVRQRLLDDIRRFVGKRAANDDMCMTHFCRLG